MKKTFISAMALIVGIIFCANAFAQTAAEQQNLDRKEAMIAKIIAVSQSFQGLYVWTKEAQDFWNAETFGVDAANEITQADIDATDYAGMPVAEVRSAMTQFFDFVTWYEGSKKGEIDKVRAIK